MYDVIGDIHGHADALKRLLAKIGYQPSDSGWSHPERKAIFVGDFVDRGPKQLETVCIAREMVCCGQALAVMGNHEFNAVSYATAHPEKPDQHLRKRTPNRIKDHEAFLNEVGEGTSLHRELLEWFETLPLFLELEGLRIVHATWCPHSINALLPHLTPQNQLKPDAWLPANTNGHQVFKAVENLIKGYEVELPNGLQFQDQGGTWRNHARLKWWEDRDLPLREAIILSGVDSVELPDEQIPASKFLGYDNLMPVLFGHYWWKGPIWPLNDRVACLDYSVADQQSPGHLVAYRWSGETKLSTTHFVSVAA